MAEIVVSAATGALKPLLKKLAAALGEEYKRFKGVRGEIKSLSEELDAMHAFLLKMSDDENPDVQDKAWMKEVRELSYDMEDSIDEFMLCVDDKSNNPDGLIAKIKKSIDKAKTRRQIAKAIEDLKIQVKQVGDRNARYKTRETISKTSNADVDRRALVIFENASKLVGLDQPKQELIKCLTIKNGTASLQPPKVISIVGSGGLGKTTLAYQVYQELQGEFKSHAFVSVSRNPDSMKVLRNILHQVSDGPHHNIHDWDLQLLISKINNSLRDERYLVVIDDIWTKEAWETINFALCNNEKNSRIITTTRMYDVAKACCSSEGDFVYQMKPLGPEDSRKLFFERLFGSEDKRPEHLKEISYNILEKCAGLPLAIISISGLLASKAPTEDEWGRVQNSIGRGLAKNTDVESMMQILSLSYFDLPHYLKTCVLYLSVFPEDSTIDKERLVKRWIAEGFIQKEQGRTLYELGERCFNELINRSLIQARDINGYGEVGACQVHDTILDFIVSKSEEENFITVFGSGYEIMHDPHNKVRRLSAHANIEEEGRKEEEGGRIISKIEEEGSMLGQLNLSHVRSVTMFDYYVELPLWPKLSFLRVLDLQGCQGVEDHHLTGIGTLFQFKYLGLGGTGVRELPGQICKLKCLETLDLKGSEVKILPADMAQLQSLVFLAVDKGVKLPYGIGRMTELEDLDCVDTFQQSNYFPRELGKLINLRNICLFISSDNSSVAAEGTKYKEYLSIIASSLCKLGHLQSLSIEFDPSIEEDSCLDSGDGAPADLRKFEMTGHFISKVPNWMRALKNLRWLTLYVEEFEVEDIMALGRLPVLLFLRLVAPESFQGREVTITGTDGFQSLRHFDYGCAIPVTFEAGAMPEIKKLTLLFSYFETRWAVGIPDFLFRVGIQHLTRLVNVECLLYCNDIDMRTWFREKRTQMADMSCQQAKATICEMDGTVEQFFQSKSEYSMETAALTLLNSTELSIRRTVEWRLERVGDGYLLDRIRFSARMRLQYFKDELEEQIRNCPLRGEGNCPCQS